MLSGLHDLVSLGDVPRCWRPPGVWTPLKDPGIAESGYPLSGEVEHLRHLFFECSFSKECWQLMGLNFEAHDMEHVSEWLVSFLASGAVLWGIWYARNKCVFDNKTMSPGIVKSWCLKQVSD